MRPVRLDSFPLGLIALVLLAPACMLLGACAKHALRCDAHLTPINPPGLAAAPAGLKPSERGSP